MSITENKKKFVAYMNKDRRNYLYDKKVLNEYRDMSLEDLEIKFNRLNTDISTSEKIGKLLVNLGLLGILYFVLGLGFNLMIGKAKNIIFTSKPTVQQQHLSVLVFTNIAIIIFLFVLIVAVCYIMKLNANEHNILNGIIVAVYTVCSFA